MNSTHDIHRSEATPAEEARLRRQNQYLTALHETTLGLIDKLDKKELLEAILERATTLTGTQHGFIYLLEPGEVEMQMRVGMGFFQGQLGRRVRMGEGIGGRVWETEAPIVVEEYSSWSWRLKDPALDRLHSVVGIPLRSAQGIQGAIGLARVEEGPPFGREDVFILSRFADLALVALEKARLYADVRRQLTERERAEAVLRESENRYRSLLESSPDPIVVYNMKGMAEYVNPAFERTFGWSRKELLGKRIDFVPPESWAETQAAIESMLGGNTIQLFETRRSTKDGRVLDIQISSTLYLDLDGEVAGNIVILRDISEQKRTEKELARYRDGLEVLVAERTAELKKSHLQLEQEVEDRKRIERRLRSQEKIREAQSRHLAEVNTALKVLLQQREQDRRELEERVLSNVGKLIAPHMERLKRSRLSPSQEALLDTLETNLDNIVSPFSSRLSSPDTNLTPMEIRVAGLIKEGRTNKEIAELLCVSKNTVMYHRYHMRKKLGIKGRKINLRSYLSSFER